MQYWVLSGGISDDPLKVPKELLKEPIKFNQPVIRLRFQLSL